MAAYYPWKTWNLKRWLSAEVGRRQGLETLSEDLQIPQRQLWQWLTDTSEDITLEQLMAMARYRRMSLQEAVQWLGIRSGHVEELVEMAEDIDALPTFPDSAATAPEPKARQTASAHAN